MKCWVLQAKLIPLGVTSNTDSSGCYKQHWFLWVLQATLIPRPMQFRLDAVKNN